MAFGRSLVPSMFARDWWDSWDFPTRIRDQHFGLGLSDLDVMPPTVYRGLVLRPRRQVSSGGLSEVKSDSDKFQVLLDVSHFAPEELTVKTVDNYVIVNAKHEEKVDEHGFVSREFTRRYMLPSGTEAESVVSSLSADGVLTVEAPKKQLPPPSKLERSVPITIQTTSSITAAVPTSPQPQEQAIPVQQQST